MLHKAGWHKSACLEWHHIKSEKAADHGDFSPCFVKHEEVLVIPPSVKRNMSNTKAMDSNTGISRRSFMKKSVVAALVATTLTVMSGLVSASTINGFYHHKEQGTTVSNIGKYPDTSTQDGHNYCWTLVNCNGAQKVWNYYACPDFADNPDAWNACQHLTIMTMPNDLDEGILGGL